MSRSRRALARILPVICAGLMLLAACNPNAATPASESAEADTVTGSPATPTPVEPTATAPAATAIPTEEDGQPDSAPDINTELMAYFPFDGNAEDGSGNGNHGTVKGATLTVDRFGQADSAYQFDGVDDYIEIADSDSLDLAFEASISLWLLYEPQATQDFYTILEKSDPERDGHSRYGLWVIRDLAEFCIEPADNSFQRCLDSEIPLQPQTWHHLVGTYDGQTLRLYVDGEPAGERQNPRSTISQNTFELFIGTDRYQINQVFTQGTIDDIRIYKRVLNEADIRMLYSQEE